MARIEKVQAEGNSVIRYGIVGVGLMGVEHIHNLLALSREGYGCHVAAICDPHVPSQEAALKALGEKAKGVKVHNSISSLLEGGECDVVVVSTPNMTHEPILLDVLSHPSANHVLVEKPMCISVAGCRKVIEASRKRPDILLQVGLEYRYMPAIAEMIKEVRRGAVGRVKMVAIREHRFPFLVKVDNWNRFNCNSGGTLVEKCCHFFDLMNLIIGQRPLKVMASGGQEVNHLDELYDEKVPDILDCAYVIVEYEGGARAMLDLCMFAEGSRNEQEVCVVGDEGKVEALIPEGIVRVGKRAGGRAAVLTKTCSNPLIKYQGFHHGSSYLEHVELLSTIQRRMKGCGVTEENKEAILPAGLEEGLLSVAIGVAAQRSIESGIVIHMKDVLEGCQ